MDYRGVIIDLDGTVYHGKSLIPAVRETIDELRDRGLSVLFLTNNPTRTRASYAEYLGEMGLRCAPEEIISAGTVTTQYLAANHARDRVFLIGSVGLREQFDRADIRMTGSPDSADVVVTSHDHEFDYEDLTEGLWALDHAEQFIGTDPDRVYPNSDGRLLPGSGAITNAVAGVADRTPDLVLGKPARQTVEVVSDWIEGPSDEWLVVGDRLATDIAFGERAGMTTVLVATGLSERNNESIDVVPDYRIDSLPEVEYIFNS